LIDEELGAFLVRLARSTVERALGLQSQAEDETQPAISGLKRGVFVSIYTFPGVDLRGCMGIPLSRTDIFRDTARAAVMSAFHDPRFPSLTPDEIDNVVFEVSVLSEPERLDVRPRADLPRHIRIGVDGLIIEAREGAALLLPQVPVEYGWEAEEYLMHLCLKAGLSLTDWLRDDIQLYRFTADVFAEEEPRGRVIKII
jgi:AmmeMemoRadiSam system protein A